MNNPKQINEALRREDMELRYHLFNQFALNDQRSYYQSTLRRFRLSAKQVNRIRAAAAFVTGLSSALAGFIVQTSFVTGAPCTTGKETLVISCQVQQTLVLVLLGLAIAMPALSAFFNTLSDLYQWDRLITIYDSARENIEVADARSPDPEMNDLIYRSSLRAFAEGTLLVMQDETAQWGQSIRTPAQLERYVIEEMAKAQQVSQGQTRLDRTEVEAQAADASSSIDPRLVSAEFDKYMAEIEAQERAKRIQQRGMLDNPPDDKPDEPPAEPEG